MPKCVKCFEFFPPQYMIQLPSEEEVILECVFCTTGKNEVTVVEDATNREEKYTKQQCIEDYKIMLKMMKESYQNGGVKNSGILNIPEKKIILQ